MKPYRNLLILAAGGLLGLGLWTWNPWQLAPLPARTVSVAVALIFWWITEALPMAAVALLPLILFPLFGVAPIGEVSGPYANPIIYLFLGGFLLGQSLEKWNLHQRIALHIVRFTGTSGNHIILGFIIATGFLSMWLSNTATTMMMFPLVVSVIKVLEETHGPEHRVGNVGICLMLAIAFASNYGGIATIIGTPPNVAYAGFVAKQYPALTIGFFRWMLLCTPLSIVLMACFYMVTTRLLFRNRVVDNVETRAVIENGIQALGPWRPAERRVIAVFAFTIFLWITKDILNDLQSAVRLDDTIIALIGGLSLFALPAGDSGRPGDRLLHWSDTEQLPWGILLLFGGGMTMATALEKAGLVQQLGQWMAGYAGSNVLGLVFLVSVISIFVSEVTSNIAQVLVCAPVMSSLADALHINPLLLGVPMTLAASAAGMMPMGTPPNAIVFASGRLKLKHMMLTGFIMNVISIILITLFSYYGLTIISPQSR